MTEAHDNERPTRLSDARILELRGQLQAAVRRACPPWLAAQAEDIVQVTLMRLVAIIEKSGGIVDLSPSYLRRAAYNATVDEIRRQFARKEVPGGDEAGTVSAPVDSGHPEGSAGASDLYEGLRDCLSGMIATRRAAVACHLQGYSVPEAARFLGWTPKKTEHLARRGLLDLRTCLAEKGLKP